MKVQFIKDQSSLIRGFTPVYYNNNTMSSDVDKIHDNQAELILATDIIDAFKVELMPELLKKLVSKTRMNGKIVIGGTDIRLFCKNVINSAISEEDASKIIGELQSCMSHAAIERLINSSGLYVEQMILNGVHYEFTVIRK